MRAFFAGRSISTRPTEACASFFFRNSRTLMSSASIGAKFLLFAYHLRAPVAVDREPESDRIDFLSHV